MGLLIKGQWKDQWYDTKSNNGEFIREDSQFRNWIAAAALNSRIKTFPVEANRYHLYVSHACPWAHRTLIFRKLKQLEDLISISVVHPDMLENGWEFRPDEEEFADHIHGFKYLHQLYTKADPDYSGRATTPVLWDQKEETIVNNESAEIIRMFNSAFDPITGNTLDFYPDHLRAEIDDINGYVYEHVNNGVYRCGFASTQQAYEKAFKSLFKALEKVEERLSRQRYLVGSQITEADWRLFTTLARFDPVYFGHFKANLKRIADYPNLSGYLKELYQFPGVKETVNIEHIKRHYYYSHVSVNPTRVVPLGPELDLDGPHNRGSIGS